MARYGNTSASSIRACVALDFGTAATGYCMALPSASGSPEQARVLPFKPGDRGSAATEKNLTAILLAYPSLKAVAFGRDARRRFFELDAADMKKCGDGPGPPAAFCARSPPLPRGAPTCPPPPNSRAATSSSRSSRWP